MGIRDDLAQHIRIVDGDNMLPPYELGWEVAHCLSDRTEEVSGFAVVELVERTNPGKTMGAAVLADAIIDHFDLEG